MSQKPVILIIEDEDLLLEAISKKIKLSDLEPVACSSGRQAFAYLESKKTKPDAIWLDYYLGDMDGLGFMQKLTAKKQLAAIPVLVISNSASPDKVHKMLALGAKEYLIKAEHRLDELVAEVKKFIENKDS